MMNRAILSTDPNNTVALRLMNLNEDILVVLKGTIVGIFEPIRTTKHANGGESTENAKLPDHIQTVLNNIDGLSPEQRRMTSCPEVKDI